jgi:hypothetical protein
MPMRGVNDAYSVRPDDRAIAAHTFVLGLVSAKVPALRRTACWTVRVRGDYLVVLPTPRRVSVQTLLSVP